jgi:two-component system, LuxR family, response regulator TtrR
MLPQLQRRDRVTLLPPVTDPSATLVVVEDDEQVRRALERFLIGHGFDVRSFESAEAWLAQFCSAQCAIVDINLPGLSGLELEARLHLERRIVPMVFITGYDKPSNGNGRRRVILRKPFDAATLLAAIRRATGVTD